MIYIILWFSEVIVIINELCLEHDAIENTILINSTKLLPQNHPGKDKQGGNSNSVDLVDC